MRKFTLGRNPTHVKNAVRPLTLLQTLNVIADFIVERSPPNVNNMATLLKIVQDLLDTTDVLLETIQFNANTVAKPSIMFTYNSIQ